MQEWLRVWITLPRVTPFFKHLSKHLEWRHHLFPVQSSWSTMVLLSLFPATWANDAGLSSLDEEQSAIGSRWKFFNGSYSSSWGLVTSRWGMRKCCWLDDGAWSASGSVEWPLFGIATSSVLERSLPPGWTEAPPRVGWEGLAVICGYKSSR